MQPRKWQLARILSRLGTINVHCHVLHVVRNQRHCDQVEKAEYRGDTDQGGDEEVDDVGVSSNLEIAGLAGKERTADAIAKRCQRVEEPINGQRAVTSIVGPARAGKSMISGTEVDKNGKAPGRRARATEGNNAKTSDASPITPAKTGGRRFRDRTVNGP